LQSVNEWFQNENFWREFFPVLFPVESFNQASDQVDKLLALTKFAGHAVLDLCCGPGRHALALAKHGFSVTGVDLSPYLLSCAESRAAQLGISVEWINQDMRHFCRNNAFDLICNMTTSFGYFEDEKDNFAVLRNVWQGLRSGGIFVIDSASKEIVARKWRDSFCSEFADGTMLIQKSQVSNDWCRLRNDWILIKAGKVHRFTYHHALYSGLELKERVLAAGFSEVHLFGDLNGTPYGTDAGRLIVLGHK
jgi:SAM-dependent methyltransferase